MNRVEISGGLVRDAEVKRLDSGAMVANMSVAVNGTRFDADSGQQEVTTAYIAVEAWGSLAEEIASLEITRGTEVYVLGELVQQTREKRGGGSESKTRVKAMTISVVRRRGGPAAARSVAQAPTGSGYDAPPHSDDEEPF